MWSFVKPVLGVSNSINFMNYTNTIQLLNTSTFQLTDVSILCLKLNELRKFLHNIIKQPIISMNMASWSNMPPPRPESFPDDLEDVKGMVGKYFPIYDVRVEFNTISLYCNIDPDQLEEGFEALRVDMKSKNFIPILKYKGGEYILHVVKQPEMKFKSPKINVVMLLATIITTILAGSMLWIFLIPENAVNYRSYMEMFDPVNLAYGALFFALPLMTILGVHEMAHYYAARKHGIAASLPFFIPIPPIFIPPLGTMGAFISIREPIPNKKALLDIGMSGPIAGFLVAIPVTAIGLILSANIPVPADYNVVSGGTLMIGESIFFNVVRNLLFIPENIVLHPLAFAGWVGIFVTALNLLPAGQLDGGHIARALLGDKARYASYGAFGLMLFLGLWYNGWIIFAMLIMLLGLRHPPPLNDVTKLDNKRKAMGAATALILVLCFVPIPFSIEPIQYDVSFHIIGVDGEATDSHTITMFSSPTQWMNETKILRLNFDGNVEANITVSVTTTNESLANATLWLDGDSSTAAISHNISMELQEEVDITLGMAIPPGANGTVIIRIFAQENTPGLENELRKELQISLELREQ